MPPENKKQLVLGQFVWTIDKKTGRYAPVFGPDPLEF